MLLQGPENVRKGMTVKNEGKCVDCGSDIFRWFDIPLCNDCLTKRRREFSPDQLNQKLGRIKRDRKRP
jgi:hypothetical protein